MPHYTGRFIPASEKNYLFWQSLGFIGSWEKYLQIKNRHGEETYYIHGDLGDHCSDCMGVGDYLCDYPVGDGKTCDRKMCDHHSNEIAPNIHYCTDHYQMWQEFKSKGGPDKALRNVIAFGREK